jgi:hypothetical protein
MRRKQRKAKKQHVIEHGKRQREKLQEALRNCEALLRSNSHKRKTLDELMERHGYIADGKGGWRRLAIQRNKSIDKR